MTRPKRSEIHIFKPGSSAIEKKIRSLIPQQCVDAVKEVLGEDAAIKAKATLEAMNENGMDFVQMTLGDRRVRLHQKEIA